MQDEIVARLANALSAQIAAAEARRAAQAPNPNSLRTFIFKVWPGSTKVWPLTTSCKRAAFSIARLVADPDNVDALVGSTLAHFAYARKFFCDRSHVGLRRGGSEADQGLVLRSRPCVGHRC